ncbi:actin-binding protein wsp1-like [Lotus japonicus]|uniref:actin-binding protein wsp1-like n=1 Tax=Lotus japonicus TaxID=34305 RepID=UPI00258A8043|nr:actin-binding protein wsp1-like [Lotus japonicus]
MKYVGGQICEVPRVELDLFSFFCVRDLVRGFLGYPDDHYKLWWKRREECFDLDLKQICLDKDAMKIARYVQSGVRQVDVYPEHTVELPVEEEPAAAGNVISPINGEKMWPKICEDPILPPEFKRGPGRPKKLRRREPDEQPHPTKLPRGGSGYTCGRCHQKGHNQRKCHLPPPPPPPISENIDEDNGTETDNLSQVFGINIDGTSLEAGAGTNDEVTAAKAKDKAPPKTTSKPPPKAAAKATSSNPKPKYKAPPKPTSKPLPKPKPSSQPPPTVSAKPPQAPRPSSQPPPRAAVTPQQPPKPSSQPPTKLAGKPPHPTRPSSQPPPPKPQQPPKATSQPTTRSAAKSGLGGRKRGRDNEIGHWVLNDFKDAATRSTIRRGKAKVVGSEGQGNKGRMSKK